MVLTLKRKDLTKRIVDQLLRQGVALKVTP